MVFGQHSLSRCWEGLLSPSVLFLSDGRFWWSSSGDTGKTPGSPATASPSLSGVGVMVSSPLTPDSQSEHFVSILLQPGKLTEAFKYFLQGMGYSKYTSTHSGQGTGTQYPCAGESVVECTLSPGPQRLGYSAYIIRCVSQPPLLCWGEP